MPDNYEPVWKRLMLEKDRRHHLTYYITFGIWISKKKKNTFNVCSLWPKYNGFTIHVSYKHGTTVPSKLIKKKKKKQRVYFIVRNKHTHPYTDIGIRFESIQLLFTYGAFSTTTSSSSSFFLLNILIFFFFDFFCFCSSSVAPHFLTLLPALYTLCAKLLWCFSPISVYFITDHHSLTFFFRSLFIRFHFI